MGLMDLAYRAFPDIPVDVTLSGQVIGKFIQGLKTRECRKLVKLSKPKTLYDALKHAVSFGIFDTYDKLISLVYLLTARQRSTK